MIATAQIDQVLNLVRERGVGLAVVEELRQLLPGVHFTHCMDDDVVGVEPVRAAETFNLYLVDGRGHCLRFTAEPLHATGLVVAELEAA